MSAVPSSPGATSTISGAVPPGVPSGRVGIAQRYATIDPSGSIEAAADRSTVTAPPAATWLSTLMRATGRRLPVASTLSDSVSVRRVAFVTIGSPPASGWVAKRTCWQGDSPAGESQVASVEPGRTSVNTWTAVVSAPVSGEHSRRQTLIRVGSGAPPSTVAASV